MVKPLALLAVLAATACTFPEDPLPPGERHIVVHAVLDPARRYQIIDLSMTDGSATVPGNLDQASVVIMTPDGTPLTARQDTVRDSTGKVIEIRPTYRIDLQSAGVALAPGGSYQLRVTTRGGDVITGTTTIPVATPGAMAAPVPFNRSRDTLRLQWTPVSGARTYEVQVWRTHTYVFSPTDTFVNRFLEHVVYADSSIALAGTAKSFDDDIFVPGSVTTIYVYAVDDNYYEYYRKLGDPFIGAAPSRLQGGLGVFGSVVPVVQRQLDVK